MWTNSFREILPHWELADSFTAIEAAALIAGVEPTSIDESLEFFRDKQSGLTVSDGIHEFTAALDILLVAIRSGRLKADCGTGHLRQISVDRDDLVEWMLSKSKRFRPAFFFPDEQGSGESASDADRQRLRQLEDENARLAEQVAQLQQQLQEATAAPQADDDKPSSRWPWGNHHTEALGHLEAAGLRFWQWFDPTDPTTAPTNDTVAGWLVSEHGEGKVRAQYIASLLRADGLPPGPRR